MHSVSSTEIDVKNTINQSDFHPPPILGQSAVDPISNSTVTPVPPVIDQIPSSMPLTEQSQTLMHHVEARASDRIFLDLCCESHRPLSQAMLSLGADVLSIDKLVNLRHNFLDCDFMESLLRVCASGGVGYTAASPSCKEYSRLKLKPGGPKALRSPTHLEGLPDLTPEELPKIQDSHTMLFSCTQALVTSSGSDGHLEQPTTAMSWSEPCVQQWLLTASCHCINLPACLYYADWRKAWMMASSLEALASLSGVCEHGPQAHQPLNGIRDSSGAFISRNTAEYPPSLAAAFAKVVIPLLSNSHRDLKLEDTMQLIPIKQLQAAPFSRQDGGGMPSIADWSSPPCGTEDIFKNIRQEVFQPLLSSGEFRFLQKAFREKQSDPPFPEWLVKKFQNLLHNFLLEHDKTQNWNIPPDQPMHLYILQSLSETMMDPDIQLFEFLIAGVPTGFQNDISLSTCFPIITDPVDTSHTHLSIHQNQLDISRR